jgi:hypothetical protein
MLCPRNRAQTHHSNSGGRAGAAPARHCPCRPPRAPSTIGRSFATIAMCTGFSSLPSPSIQKSGLPPLPKPAAGCPVSCAVASIASLFVDRYGWFRLPKRKILGMRFGALPSYHQKGLDGGDADEQKGDAARTFAPHAAAVPPYSESAYDQNLHDLVALISQQRVILCSVTMTRDRIWRWYSCYAGASLPASAHDRDAGWLRPRAHAGPPSSRRCRAACPRARGCAR